MGNETSYWDGLMIIDQAHSYLEPGKPGLTSFSETLALFFIQFLPFWKMKVQDKQNGPSKSFRAYQKKLAGYAPVDYIYRGYALS